MQLNFISKVFSATLCTLVFHSVRVNGRIGRVRDVDGLAPELNRGGHPLLLDYLRNITDLDLYVSKTHMQNANHHPHKQRSAESLRLSVCFAKSISAADMSDFEEFFDEFVIKRLPGFDI
eukprot:Awhi_evm1s9588